MEYKGKLYAKVGGKYIECTETVEQLESRIKELEQTIENMKAIAGEKIESINVVSSVDYTTELIQRSGNLTHDYWYYCQECLQDLETDNHNFCPNCGRKIIKK